MQYILYILILFIVIYSFKTREVYDSTDHLKDIIVKIYSQNIKFNWLEPYKNDSSYESIGTGFFIAEDIILTASHVIEKSIRVDITIPSIGKKKFKADVVYGSRFKGSEAKRILYFKNRIANYFLSFLVSLLTNINFSDVETGYKLVKSDLFKKLNLKENTFAIEIEITMKLAKKNLKFYEVGISYNGRTFEEGKKIRMIDGIIALFKIFYYFFRNK